MPEENNSDLKKIKSQVCILASLWDFFKNQCTVVEMHFCVVEAHRYGHKATSGKLQGGGKKS